MKNWLKILLIITIITSSLSYGLTAAAEISVYDIDIEAIKDNSATLTFRTNEELKSIVYYGLDAEKLNYKISNLKYTKDHQFALGGLEEDETYYYQIKLLGREGNYLDLYPRTFSTKDMEDNRAPELLEADIVQVISNDVAISWKADEKVRAEITYWPDGDEDSKKTKKVNSWKSENFYYLYNLEPHTKYYLKISIKDKAGNKDSKTFLLNVYEKLTNEPDMEIRNIKPLHSSSQLVSYNQATITFNTSLATQVEIKYGTSANRLNKKAKSENDKISTSHKITITDLKPNTTYYYKIVTTNAFNKKKAEVKNLSFITKSAQVAGVKVSGQDLDSDNDGLNDDYEISIGTNPKDSDTDNDGYPDGLEVANGYSPLGPGRWSKSSEIIYGQARTSLDYEKTKAIELKNILEQKIGKFSISNQNWFTIVNAYVYGGYPIEAISQSIKWSGKTVHPSIAWSSWKNSNDYINYISK